MAWRLGGLLLALSMAAGLGVISTVNPFAAPSSSRQATPTGIDA